MRKGGEEIKKKKGEKSDDEVAALKEYTFISQRIENKSGATSWVHFHLGRRFEDGFAASLATGEALPFARDFGLGVA